MFVTLVTIGGYIHVGFRRFSRLLAMTDPRIKILRIKTGVVRRLAKEKSMYEKEAEQQRGRIQKYKDEGKDEHEIKKQEEVLGESLMMVPDCQKRLVKAFEELKVLLENESDLADQEEYTTAQKVLEEAKAQLPNSKLKMHQDSQLNSEDNTNSSSQMVLNPLSYIATTVPPQVFNIPPPNMYIPPYIKYTESHGATYATNSQVNVLVPPFPPPTFQNNYSINFGSVPEYETNANNSKQFQLESQLSLMSQETKFVNIPNFFDSNEKIHNKVFSDAQWIESKFLKEKGKNLKFQPKKFVKIGDSKENFKKCIYLLQELEMLKDNMQNNYQNIDVKTWNSLRHNLLNLKNAISEHVVKLPDIVNLQKAIKRRCDKRRSQKRRNLRRKEAKVINSENRQVLHHKIDTWLKLMQRSIDQNKREESLKKEADSILAEVLRKKAEGRRQLALVEALLKLRQLRAKNAAIRGQHVPPEDGVRFEKVAENLKALWEKQLVEYNVEEQGMRVMLSEAVDERDQSQVTRERQILSQWDKLLFGNRPCEFPEFYLAAERNTESFVSIRHSWDKLAVFSKASVQSNIPVGWVLPSYPSSSNWESLLSSVKSDM